MNWLKKLFGKKQKPVEQTEVKNQSVRRNYRTTTSETTHPTYIGNQEDLLNPLNIMSPLNPLNPIHNSFDSNHNSNDSSPSYDNGNDSSSYDSGSSYDSSSSSSNW